MTTGEIATIPVSEAIERVLVKGDLSELTAAQRVEYYHQVCRSMRLNPLTRPFDYIKLNGLLTLYAKRDCAEQLRRRDSVSVSIVSRERLDDVYVVTAHAILPDGRFDESTGVVSLTGLRGEFLANALMKAETKAKRRVTLSICGLGWLDETEIETVRDARVVEVTADGEVVEPKVQPAPQPKRNGGPRLNKWEEFVEEAYKLGYKTRADVWAAVGADSLEHYLAQAGTLEAAWRMAKANRPGVRDDNDTVHA